MSRIKSWVWIRRTSAVWAESEADRLKNTMMTRTGTIMARRCLRFIAASAIEIAVSVLQ